MEGQGSPEPPPLHTSEGITLGTTQHSWTPGSLLDPLLGFAISVMPCLFSIEKFRELIFLDLTAP